MSSMKIRLSVDKEFSPVEKMAFLLIALSPILQHYKGFFMNGGVSVLLLALPYVLIKIIGKKGFSLRAVLVILPLILFLLYKVIDHGTYLAESGQAVLLLLFALAFSSKAIDSRGFIQAAVFISVVASVLIILQYITYYVLGFHMQLVPTSLLLSSSKQWIKLAQTGRVGITGRTISFYRPSSFFLEPSHMFLYLFSPLYYELLHPSIDNRRKQIAIIISIGIVLSTSGMGIAVTAAAWLLFFAKKGGRNNRVSLAKLLRPQNVVIIMGIVAVITVLYFHVDFFHQSINRIINGTGLQKIVSGRTARGNAVIRSMHGKQLIIGISDKYSDIEFNMSGFNGTMYKYGIVGTLLSYLFYVQCLFRFKQQHFWIAVVVIIVSFFTAHTHGTFYMLYYVIFLLDGYNRQNKKVLK